ncbi:ABC transporter permease subunit/CPBP intramembrane protease [Anoxynatronum buryatiense]|uniref:Sodium transport system permease protein n=1 Tax=Anoxynatronum buryatiense TaxID=489973 RepID=A0AA45WXU6_9CLOT|nr:ABC transporter permease subunit/CPBP intramembrane protease [Anoxynatronum buryatiense]SMP66136.1 sodium transport system permease protein [Anoxynatronum buryatiense]
MNWKVIRTLMGKEIRSLLRNKRVLLGMLAPVLVLPLLVYGFRAVTEGVSREAAATVSRIMITGELPASLETALAADQRLELVVSDAPVSGISPEVLAAYRQAAEAENLDMILRYEDTREGHVFQLIYDVGHRRGVRGAERLTEHLETFRDAEELRLLETAGLSPALLKPVELQLEDLAGEEERAGSALSNILPLILTLYAMVSVVNFAVELTTAEKETGTLETLFSMPIRGSDLITAKLLACVLFGVVSMVVSLGVLIPLMPLLAEAGVTALTFTSGTWVALLLTLLPLIFIAAGTSMTMGLFANSYKESGAYMTPLLFAFMIPAYVGITPGLELNAFYALVPVLNATLLLKSVLLGNLEPALLGITLVTNSFFSMASLTLMVKAFGTEKLLFGIGTTTTFTLQRHRLQPRSLIAVEDVFMTLSLVVILFIYLSTILTGVGSLLTGTLVVQYLVFALLPIGILWYLKATPVTSLGLRRFTLRGLGGGLGVWLAAFSLALMYQMLITPFITQVPTLVELEAELTRLSPLAQFLFIAVTPGICEEILFRGFAFRPLEAKWGPKAAILITALLFALVHMDFIRLIPTFLLGLAFGYVTWKTRSIYPAMALHILNNGLALMALEHVTLQWLPLLVLLVLGLGSGWWLLKPLPVKNDSPI